MKKISLIAILTSIMILASSAFCFADGGFEVAKSYPKDGQKNTSIENLGVKLYFTKPLNSEEAQKVNADKFSIIDEDGTSIPIKVLFSDKEEGLVLVLADVDNTDRKSKIKIKNNSEYKLIISGELVDNDGDVFGEDKVITFKTYNQKVNNMVNMIMMFVMFGGIMVLSLRQNKDNEDDEDEAAKAAAFNPYKEAKRTGKSIEEVKAEQAKKEAKEAKKKARKKKNEPEQQYGKIENCAELLNNVYHVHAPAPVSREDRSVEALKAMRKAEKNSKGKSSKKK